MPLRLDCAQQPDSAYNNNYYQDTKDRQHFRLQLVYFSLSMCHYNITQAIVNILYRFCIKFLDVLSKLCYSISQRIIIQ